jgi:hypothetical protein
MIAAIQNIRILMRRAVQKPKALAAAVIGAKIGVKQAVSSLLHWCWGRFKPAEMVPSTNRC